MPQTLNLDSYTQLKDEIIGIWKKFHSDAGALFLESCRKTGERIVEIEQKGAVRAPYGKHLLEQVSHELTAIFGKGFSVTNLDDMRHFYIAYPISQHVEKLTWDHYRVLSRIADPKVRTLFERKAIQEKLSSYQFRELIRKEKALLAVTHQPSKMSDAKSSPTEIPRLPVRRGELSTYKLIEVVDEVDVKSLVVDCGFYIDADEPFKGLTNPTVGDVVRATQTPSGSFRFKRLKDPKAAGKILYTYKGMIHKIIDGDTLTVRVDCGLARRIRKKLRLRSIDCPEIDTEEGKAAKAFVENLLKPCRFIVIKTYSTDVHDRYIVDVFYLPGESDPAKVAVEGMLLNQTLLDAGHAKLWERVDPAVLAFME